jgi:hypothetical protein
MTITADFVTQAIDAHEAEEIVVELKRDRKELRKQKRRARDQ